jgi:hypothetical protein
MTTLPALGNVLGWDGSAWVPVVPAGGSGALNDLTDVDDTAVAATGNYVLAYDMGSGSYTVVPLPAPALNDFQMTFDASDWTVGSPNTLVIPQTIHMLPYVAGEIYTVTVTDVTGCQVEVTIQTNLTNGDVTLSSVGTSFDGIVRIF